MDLVAPHEGPRDGSTSVRGPLGWEKYGGGMMQEGTRRIGTPPDGEGSCETSQNTHDDADQRLSAGFTKVMNYCPEGF